MSGPDRIRIARKLCVEICRCPQNSRQDVGGMGKLTSVGAFFGETDALRYGILRAGVLGVGFCGGVDRNDACHDAKGEKDSDNEVLQHDKILL